MDYKEKVITLLNSQELSKEQKEKLEEIFPELKERKESEDEQHRKWILAYLYDGLFKADEQFKGQFKTAIAWLEKQEQKYSWSYVDEADLNNIIWLCNNCINGSETTWIPSQAIRIKSLIERIKNTIFLQSKQECSEEDEAKLKSACALIRNTRLNGNEGIVDSTIDWIKSIKDKVQSQPKQEWSEEDENMYTRTLGILGKCYMGVLPAKVEEELKWFKSLRERC